MKKNPCGTIEIVGARFRGLSQRQVNELIDQPVTFVREPSNVHDANAIMCYAEVDAADNHIGYVPAKLAQYFAPMMDAGLSLSAIVSATYPPRLAITATLMMETEDEG